MLLNRSFWISVMVYAEVSHVLCMLPYYIKMQNKSWKDDVSYIALPRWWPIFALVSRGFLVWKKLTRKLNKNKKTCKNIERIFLFGVGMSFCNWSQIQNRKNWFYNLGTAHKSTSLCTNTTGEVVNVALEQHKNLALIQKRKKIRNFSAAERN